MITDILGWIADRAATGVALRHLRRDPVVQMGREAIRLSTTAPWMTQTSRSFSKDFIPNIAKQMMQVVTEIATAPDPRMANRDRLVGVVVELAQLQVLVLEPPPHPDPTELRGKPGITGELMARIPEIASKADHLRDFFDPYGGVRSLRPDELLYNLTVRCVVLHGWGSMHQSLRMAWNDAMLSVPSTDWYRPLVENQCAVEEQRARKLLGMESSLGYLGRRADIEALARATFMNVVLSGVVDPVSEWKEHYKGWNL